MTLADPEVRRTLREFVLVRRDAGPADEEDLKRYGVIAFPTVLLLEPDGTELDRISGYEQPARFLAELADIRAGRTIARLLATLRPGECDHARMRGLVQRLIAACRPADAVRLVQRFHPERVPSCCARDLASARLDLQATAWHAVRLSLHKGQLPRAFVPEARAQALAAFVASLPSPPPPYLEVRARLREVRHADASAALASVGTFDGPARLDWFLAQSAFDAGAYGEGAALYRRFFSSKPLEAWPPAQLVQAADQLLRSGLHLDEAKRWALAAYARQKKSYVAEPLARILFATGSAEEAHRVARAAARRALLVGDLREAHRMARLESGIARGRLVPEAPGFDRF